MLTYTSNHKIFRQNQQCYSLIKKQFFVSLVNDSNHYILSDITYILTFIEVSNSYSLNIVINER